MLVRQRRVASKASLVSVPLETTALMVPVLFALVSTVKVKEVVPGAMGSVLVYVMVFVVTATVKLEGVVWLFLTPA